MNDDQYDTDYDGLMAGIRSLLILCAISAVVLGWML